MGNNLGTTLQATMIRKVVKHLDMTRRTSVGRSPLRGADAHREVGPGMETMMEMTTMVIQMTVTANSSEE